MLNILRGWTGEKLTQAGLWFKLDSDIYKRYHDIIFPTFNGTTQVDHLLLSKYGIFVIETKNVNGWIFGDERSKQWTQSLYGKKYRFQNPLHQNYRHTKAVASYLDIDPNNVHSIVFFIGENTQLKTELPSNVMTHGLSKYIKSFQRSVFSEDEISKLSLLISRLKEQSISRKDHVQNLEVRHSSITTCPKCGKPLVQRTAKKGNNAGNSFLGCSGFPSCRYIKSLT